MTHNARTDKLNPNFLAGIAQPESLRDAFDMSLTTLAKSNSRIVGLSADLASSAGLKTFAKTMRERYIEVGVAEQNLVGVASGLAHAGYIPFTASYAAFSPGRNWEQIRTAVCLNDQPVKIIGSHAGLNVGADGATHQMLEDIALMRSLPNMTVLAPGDAIEAAAFAALMAASSSPNYIRLPRVALPSYNSPEASFEIGRIYPLWYDNDATVCIISTGSLTGEALRAIKLLHASGVRAILLHAPTIKPLDSETILSHVGQVNAVATVEEHQLSGGFGELVATTLLEAGVIPAHFLRIGVDDKFGESGTAAELWHRYGLDAESIAKRVLATLTA